MGQSIELVVLSLWLGAAVLVAAAVAPAAFAVLPSRTLAGALVGRVLPVIFFGGMGAAIIAVVCEMTVSPESFSLKLSAPLIAVAAGCAIAQFVITPRIETIRAAVVGPIESLGATDPRRLQFGRLHAVSVLWLGVAMLGAAIAIGIQLFTSSKTKTLTL